MTDLLQATADLVAISSPSHDEGAITDHIAEVISARAPWLEVHRVGHNLVARTMLGRDLRLILAGHTDTVPINGNFPGHLDGDVLRGVGSSDMKSGIAVMLELACTQRAPALDVTYVFYEAEEVAAVHNGLARLVRERPELLEGDVALLGEPTDGAIEAGCQGTLRVEVTFAGARAHPARPWMGRNAIHRLGPALGRIASYVPRQPVLDGCEFHEAMQVLGISGGVSGNVVPDKAVLTVNHRFAPDRSIDEAVQHVRDVIGEIEADDRFEVVDASPAAPPSLDHPVLQALVRRQSLAVRAKLGWTDVARFAQLGIPAANFGPGDATLAHTANEWVGRGPIERVHLALADLLRLGA